MATDSAAATGGRAGITFDVELVVSWDAPGAVVDLDSDGVVTLHTLPDVISLTGWRPGAAVVRILQGRDVRSVRALVPDPRGLEQGFHDVTIVDMGDLPEPSVSMDELSLLRRQWPATVLRHMVWLQQDLDTMRAEAKNHFRATRPGDCSYCGKWIKCDMYHHVATYHLELSRLWRCPVSWCTVWKGTPQDCMDHVRRAHDVPWDVKSASLEKFVPPWTVRRQVWTDSLKPCHSGVSTDVLLFSEVNESLVHHYRVHKRGLPHLTFRRDYLQVFVSQAAALSQGDMVSPVQSSPVSMRHARSSEQESESPWKTSPIRVSELVGVGPPTLTVRDASDLTGAVVRDCRPPLLPVSLRLKDIGPLPLRRPAASTSLAEPPPEDSVMISGASPEGVAILELGVAPSDDRGTDLEDELPTPMVPMLISDSSPEGIRLPGVSVALPEDSDSELEDELLHLSALPAIVWPLMEPVVAPSAYPEPPVPVQLDASPDVRSRVSPPRVAVDDPILDLFPSYLISPAHSGYDPVTSPISHSLQEDADFLPPDSPATMDQYLSGHKDMFCGEIRTADLTLLSLPLLPIPATELKTPGGLRHGHNPKKGGLRHGHE